MNSKTILLTSLLIILTSDVYCNQDIFSPATPKKLYSTPMFKVIPIYPRVAQREGIMGYTVVMFTITDNGTVKDPYVVKRFCSHESPEDPFAYPCSLFDSASLKAAIKLKYKPKIVGGKAISVEGALYKFSYTLDKSKTAKKPIKYKKARALQSSTAKKMAKVYEALEAEDEKGEPAPDMDIVLSILNELKNDMANLKSYDRSVMWNAWAFVYFQDGDYPNAMNAYAKLINEPEVTIGLRVQALLSLAQLNLLQEEYEESIKLILQWMSEVEKITAQSYSLLGQAYYQIGDFKKALSSMETAVTIAEEEGYKPRENWYVIMTGSIVEMKTEIRKSLPDLVRLADIYETLAYLYPKKRYSDNVKYLNQKIKALEDRGKQDLKEKVATGGRTFKDLCLSWGFSESDNYFNNCMEIMSNEYFQKN